MSNKLVFEDLPYTEKDIANAALNYLHKLYNFNDLPIKTLIDTYEIYFKFGESAGDDLGDYKDGATIFYRKGTNKKFGYIIIGGYHLDVFMDLKGIT